MGHVMIEARAPHEHDECEQPQPGARGALCQRDRCPYGTPCADTGAEPLLAAAPIGAGVVCTVDQRVVWTNGEPFGSTRALERHVAELVRADGQRAVVDALARPTTTRVETFAAGSLADAVEVVVAAPRVGVDRQRVVYWRAVSTVTPGVREVLDGLGAFALVAEPTGAIEWLSSVAGDVLTAFVPGAGDEPGRPGVAARALDADTVRFLAARAAAALHRTGSVELRLRDGTVRVAVVRLLPRGAVLLYGRLADEPAADAAAHPLSSAMDAIARELAWSGYGPSRSVGIGRIAGAELLNDRERDTLLFVAQGLRSNAIAQRMFVSGSTIRNYLSAIYRKLGVANHAELVELLFADGDGRD